MKKLANYTMFTTPTCHFCHDLKGWLADHDISYEVKDVAADMEARQQMVEKSGQLGVPVSLIQFDDNSEEVVIGFAPDYLEQILGSSDPKLAW